MEYKIIGNEDIKISKWSGGITREIAIFPENSKYENRDFDFRISSATVENEESVFTKLPGYERIIMILDGKLKLVHEGKYSLELNQYEKDLFSGQWDTVSYGKVLDFNLMFSSKYKGEMDHFKLKKEETIDLAGFCGEEYVIIYVDSGSAEINILGETSKLCKGESIFIKKVSKNGVSIFNSASEESDIIVNTICLKD